MRRYGIIAALALLALVNTIVLYGVAYNRSGEPEAVITLSERELQLQYHYMNSRRENSGVALTLLWHGGAYYYGGLYSSSSDVPYTWFDKDKLQAVGFDCSVPPAAPDANDFYMKARSRKVFAVLENNGAVYEKHRNSIEKKIAELRVQKTDTEKKETLNKDEIKRLERKLKTGSRLFAVDAGTDPALLRQQYPDRGKYIITPAQAHLRLRNWKDPSKLKQGTQDPPKLYGVISRILVNTIHVTKEQGEMLYKLKKTDDAAPKDYSMRELDSPAPRYRVVLNYGKRYEPWIASIQPLDEK